jgi:hypothetical protein
MPLLLIMVGHIHTITAAPTHITDIMATVDIIQIMDIMVTDITQIIYQIAH